MKTCKPTSQLQNWNITYSIPLCVYSSHVTFPLFLHSPVKKHLNCIPFFDITMNAAVNTIYIFHGACV